MRISQAHLKLHWQKTVRVKDDMSLSSEARFSLKPPSARQGRRALGWAFHQLFSNGGFQKKPTRSKIVAL
jgi:hypothetical protein